MSRTEHYGSKLIPLYPTSLIIFFSLFSLCSVYHHSKISDYYTNPSTLNSNGRPYAFFSDMQCFTNCAFASSFPVIFDRRMTRSQVSSLIRYLDEGSYLDSNTRSLKVEVVTYNPMLEQFTDIFVEANLLKKGIDSWSLTANYAVINVELYNFALWNFVRAILEGVFILCLIGLVFLELLELVSLMKSYGKVAGLILYFTNFGNITDIINYGVQMLV